MTNEYIEIKRLQILWARRKTNTPCNVFQKHYDTLEKKCVYCGIREGQIKELIDSGKLTTKRLGTRGRKLELDRMHSEHSYDNLDNIVLACYWCNNAKTDTFTHEEFLKIGSVISDVWKQRLYG